MAGIKPSKKGSHIFEHISIQERINFARHLALIVKAGLPLLEGLKIIRRQTSSKTLVRVIDELMNDVNNGQFLADSLARHTHLFGDFFINVVRVGESSGTLAQNLLYLAEEMKKSHELKNTVRSALVYPMIILVMSIAVTGLLTFFVFPKLLPVFTELGVNLPITTRILIVVMSFLFNYGVWLLVGLVALIFAARILRRITIMRIVFDRLLLTLPVISGLVVNVNVANFARVLAILLRSGVQIVEAVTITSKTFTNVLYKRALAAAAEEVRKGEQLALSLTKNKLLFPPLMAGMIEMGENTGNLETNLAYLADYYADEVTVTLRNLTTLLEPVLLLVMGSIVAFVAISIVTPIYSISQSIK